MTPIEATKLHFPDLARRLVYIGHNQIENAMKHFILLTIAVLAGYAASAHHGRTKASIYAEGPYNIQVFVNGYLMNERPSRWVDLNHLAPGRHVVEIKAFGPRRVKYLSQVIHLRPGFRSEYLVSSYGAYQDLFMTRDAVRPISYARHRVYPVRRDPHYGHRHRRGAYCRY